MIFFKTVIAAFSMVSIMGCAGMLSENQYNRAKDALDVTETICTSVRLFVDAGVNVPGTDQCDRILPLLDSEDLKTVVAVLDCAAKYEPESEELLECALDNGWPVVRDKIVSLYDKKSGSVEK